MLFYSSRSVAPASHICYFLLLPSWAECRVASVHEVALSLLVSLIPCCPGEGHTLLNCRREPVRCRLSCWTTDTVARGLSFSAARFSSSKEAIAEKSRLAPRRRDWLNAVLGWMNVCSVQFSLRCIHVHVAYLFLQRTEIHGIQAWSFLLRPSFAHKRPPRFRKSRAREPERAERAKGREAASSDLLMSRHPQHLHTIASPPLQPE